MFWVLLFVPVVGPEEGLIVGNRPPGLLDPVDPIDPRGPDPPRVFSGGSPANGLVFPVVPAEPLVPFPFPFPEPECDPVPLPEW